MASEVGLAHNDSGSDHRHSTARKSDFADLFMIQIINDKCDYCGACVGVCPFDAIDLYESRIEINERCTDCMLCVWICPVETLAPAGEDGRMDGKETIVAEIG